jgi:hypothetical protein
VHLQLAPERLGELAECLSVPRLGEGKQRGVSRQRLGHGPSHLLLNSALLNSADDSKIANFEKRSRRTASFLVGACHSWW